MRPILLLSFVAALAGCQTNQGALTGAAIGATAGATLADSDDQIEATLAGGAIGAAVGNAVGNRGTTGTRCRYTRPDGSQYIAACP